MPKLVRNTKRPETWARRYSLNMKTTKEMRERMIALASASGRSLTLEVEFQLEKAIGILDMEATLRRVVREEIAAERREQSRAVVEALAKMDIESGKLPFQPWLLWARDGMQPSSLPDDEPIAGMQ